MRVLPNLGALERVDCYQIRKRASSIERSPRPASSAIGLVLRSNPQSNSFGASVRGG